MTPSQSKIPEDRKILNSKITDSLDCIIFCRYQSECAPSDTNRRRCRQIFASNYILSAGTPIGAKSYGNYFFSAFRYSFKWPISKYIGLLRGRHRELHKIFPDFEFFIERSRTCSTCLRMLRLRYGKARLAQHKHSFTVLFSFCFFRIPSLQASMRLKWLMRRWHFYLFPFRRRLQYKKKVHAKGRRATSWYTKL